MQLMGEPVVIWLAITLLVCLAVFLELARRAPVMEDSDFGIFFEGGVDNLNGPSTVIAPRSRPQAILQPYNPTVIANEQM